MMRPPLYARQPANAATQVRVGVGIVIWNAAGQILLERRSDCGWWGLPGGRIEPGETIRGSALREVEEETGLKVHLTHLVGVYSDPGERLVVYPDHAAGVQLVDIILAATVAGGTLRCSSESREVRFFAPDSLPAEIVPPAQAPLADALNGRRGVIA